MGKRKFIHLLLLISVLVAALLLQHVAPEEPTAAADYDDQYYHIKRTCNSTIGECNAEEEEMMMESEISRRLLAGSGKKISPDTLKAGIPSGGCGKGKPYRPCLPGGNNGDHRGCNPHYLCKGNDH